MLTQKQINDLYQENKSLFRTMDRVAGNMIKGLLWELQDLDRNTYIRLKEVSQNGFAVSYELVQGDIELVRGLADTLGFKSWDDNLLEVYHG